MTLIQEWVEKLGAGCESRQANALVRTLVLTLWTTSAIAWESDMHYGLTVWLAHQVGFEESDALKIGDGAQMHDTGWITPVHLGAYACYFRDKNSLYTIGERHFPSANHAPSEPKRRAVTPNENVAVNAIQNAIKEQADPVKFGRLLHPLQDSWSHQGVPDVPIFCWSDYAYSHPRDRGGWWRHKSDLTYLYPTDALLTARVTYEMLGLYRQSRVGGAQRKWSSSVEAKVVDFIEADTLLRKWMWFDEQQVPNRSKAVEGISLPFGSDEIEARARRFRGAPPADGAPLLIGDSEQLTQLRRTVDEFLKDWISEARFERVRPRSMWWQKYADLDQITKNFGIPERGKSGADDIAVAFNMWLAGDHGVIETHGHGERETLGRLADVLASLKTSPMKSLADALLADVGGNIPYVLASEIVGEPGQTMKFNKDRATLFFRFAHAPHDGLLVSFERRATVWKIVNLAWTIDD